MAGLLNDWQLSCTEMKQRGQYILESGQWSDCTFLVGSEPSQVVIRGHKLILAMASPVFEAMFFGGMAERNDMIPILDVQPDAFRALLEYIYTDNINITTFDKACELCYGAKKYMLPHLVKECTRYLWSDLSPKNACRAYEFARLFEESVLMEKCLQIISNNTMEVLQDSSFTDIEPDTLITVFTLDELTIDSELDLFRAAERYAKAQQRRNTDEQVIMDTDQRKSPEPSTSKVVNIESSAESSPEVVETGKTDQDTAADNETVVDDTQKNKSNDDYLESDQPVSDGGRNASDIDQDSNSRTENEILDHPAPSPSLQPKAKKPASDLKEKEKQSVRGAIEKIRFLTFTPQQFAEGPAKSTLLTESESFAVLMNILSSTADLPMPAGFSTCRMSRKRSFPTDQKQILSCPSPDFVDAPRLCDRTGFKLKRDDFMEVIGPQACSSLVQLPDSPEVHRVYCHRAILHMALCHNTSAVDCCVTFMVDKNICLLGLQVPTQTPPPTSGAPPAAGAGYSELLYAHLLDADGARVTYTHYSNRVPYRHLLDIMFNRPVYIQRNKVYKVGVVFNKMGWYQMGTCAKQVAAESVFFNFGIGPSEDSFRDGLIRSIIFTY